MTSMSVVDFEARPWDSELGHSRQLREARPFSDVSLNWDFVNESNHWLLLIMPDNTRRIIPPRTKNYDRIVIQRVNYVREPVNIDYSTEYNVSPVQSNSSYAGFIKDLKEYKSGYVRNIPQHIVEYDPAPGRQYFDGKRYQGVGDEFIKQLKEVDFGRAVYLTPIDCVLVKLTGEPAPSFCRRFNHPYFGRYRDLSDGMEIDRGITAFDFEWHNTSPNATSLWTLIGGHAVEIPCTEGAGLDELIIRDGDGEIIRRIEAKDVLVKGEEFGLFLTKNAAVAWMSPIEAQAQKHKYDEQSQRRKFENDELKRSREASEAAEKRMREMELERKAEREAAEKREREREAERRTERAEERKREEEQLKREREDKQRKAQLIPDTLKTIAAVLGAIVTLFAAVSKLSTLFNKK